MRHYVSNSVYLQRQIAGAPRLDLDGAVAGTVSEEHAAQARERLAGIAARRKRKATKVETSPVERQPPKIEVEPPKPRRLGLADLKAAALKRKAQTAA